VKERVAKLVLKDGALLSASASEPNSSSLLPRAYRFSVVARKVAGGYRLHGRKMFCSMFEASDYCYLFVHPEGHPNPYKTMAVLVPTKQDELTVTDIWETLGLRATRSNQVDYHGAFVPDDLVLCELDDFVQGFIIQEAAWAFGGFCACYMGLGLAIVDFARQHLSTRKATGYAQVIGYHPDISRRFAEMVVDAETARLMVYRAAWESDQRGPGMETFQCWLKAKMTVGAAVQRIVNNAAIACGMHSLFRNQGLELLIRDATTAPIMPPNSDLCAATIGLLSLGLDPGAAPSLSMSEPLLENSLKP
jgi:alkylation response protein AidB-like acyl-CoA dehydrogenase